MIWFTPMQSMPIPKAIVLITMRSGASGSANEAMMVLLMLFRVTAVNMSTRQNMDKFGAPIGSVNCFFIQVSNNMYSSEQSLYVLQNITTRAIVHLEASNLLTSGINTLSILHYSLT